MPFRQHTTTLQGGRNQFNGDTTWLPGPSSETRVEYKLVNILIEIDNDLSVNTTLIYVILQSIVKQLSTRGKGIG